MAGWLGKKMEVAEQFPARQEGRDGPSTKIWQKKVVPGIEPGLPECSDAIRIRSDNRYTTQPLNDQQLIAERVAAATVL